jgi:hypothetical protein
VLLVDGFDVNERDLADRCAGAGSKGTGARCVDSGTSYVVGPEVARLCALGTPGRGKGKASVVRYRRGLVVLSPAGGKTVPVIAQLIQCR